MAMSQTHLASDEKHCTETALRDVCGLTGCLSSQKKNPATRRR